MMDHLPYQPISGPRNLQNLVKDTNGGTLSIHNTPHAKDLLTIIRGKWARGIRWRREAVCGYVSRDNISRAGSLLSERRGEVMQGKNRHGGTDLFAGRSQGQDLPHNRG